MEEGTSLYEAFVPVHLKPNDREAKLQQLTVKVYTSVNKANHNQRVLHVQLTDEADPFFLFSLDVSEEDFQSLKTEQSLLVDFAGFPAKFIELLDLCVQSGKDGHERFLAHLLSKGGVSHFNVVETNPFKHLCHLSLQLRPGNDASVKKYLASRLADFKASNESLRSSLQESQHLLGEKRSEVERLYSEVRDLKEAVGRSTADLRAQHSLAMADAKERALQQQDDIQRRFEKEKRDMELAHDSKVRQLQLRLDELNVESKELSEVRIRQEASIRELTTQLHTSQEELSRTKTELSSIRTELKSVDSARFQADRGLNDHILRVTALEQQLRDKDELLSKMSALQESAGAQKGHLEDSMNMFKTNCAKLEEKVKLSFQEINKGNQIIERLQAELRAAKTKIKTKNSVITQQEQTVKERHTVLEQHLREIGTLKESLATQKSAADNLQSALDSANQKLQESQNLLQSNQQVIQYLNSQINEAQLGRYGSVTSGAGAGSGVSLGGVASGAHPTICSSPAGAASSAYTFRPSYSTMNALGAGAVPRSSPPAPLPQTNSPPRVQSSTGTSYRPPQQGVSSLSSASNASTTVGSLTPSYPTSITYRPPGSLVGGASATTNPGPTSNVPLSSPYTASPSVPTVASLQSRFTSSLLASAASRATGGGTTNTPDPFARYLAPTGVRFSDSVAAVKAL